MDSNTQCGEPVAERRKASLAKAVATPLFALLPPEALRSPAAPRPLGELLDRSGTVYLRWDFTAGAILDVSASVRAVLGYSRDDFLTNPRLAERITHPEFGRKLPTLLAQWAADHPDHLRFEGQYVHKDGREVW